MGRASSSKKVARAARAAGRPGTGRNWLWPAAVVVMLAVGVTLVWVSRPEGAATEQSPAIGDHWHAAYGVYTCDGFAAPLTDEAGDPLGIHTHGDGLIHIHPTSTSATGDKATLKVFADDTGLKIDDRKLQLPGKDPLVEGEDECDGKPGKVQLAVWDDASDEEPDLVTEDVAGQKLRNGELLTIAFAPEGADLPKPNTAPRLSDANAAEENRPVVPIEGVPDPSTSTTAAEGGTTPAPAPDGGTTTSTAAPDSSTSSSAP